MRGLGAVIMTATHNFRQMPDQVFVEIIGVDGLAHHVGPFQTSAQAEAWIELNATDKDCPKERPDQKVTVAGGGVLLRPTD